MGRAVGGAIVKGAKIAIENKLPYVIVTSSGGARMQEGILALMQMPRTIIAIKKLEKKKFLLSQFSQTLQLVVFLLRLQC